MKIQRDTFTNAVNAVSKVIEPRATLPILSGIVLTPVTGGLTITATNLETGMELRLDASSDGDMLPVVLAVKPLQAVLRSIPKNVKELQIKAEVEPTGSLVAFINGVKVPSIAPHEDYPTVALPKDGTTL
jgi:DNA polymerase III sliding clamp (beta) subunit (PCNA family)